MPQAREAMKVAERPEPKFSDRKINTYFCCNEADNPANYRG